MASKRAALTSAAPWIAPVLGIAVLIAVFAWFSSDAKNTDELRLTAILDEVVFRIEEQAEAHLSLLRATHAFVEVAEAPMSLEMFRTFVSRLKLRGRYLGIQGLGYLPKVTAAEVPEMERVLAEYYGPAFKIWPSGADDILYPIIYIEPLDELNAAALGFDMYSEEVRREAMDRAARTTEHSVSGVVTLTQEWKILSGQQQPGFLIFQAVRRRQAADESEITGFVYAPFRGGDFFSTAIGPAAARSVAIEVYDGAPEGGVLLYASDGAKSDPDTGDSLTKIPAIVGRMWTVRVTPKAAFMADSTSAYLPAVALLGLLLAGTLALLSWQQSRAQESARRDAERLSRVNDDKDLLLQEMKHRIKNVIARVQAIGRQTVRASSGLDEFQASFDSRLTAMAKTYDLLTQSQWTGAELEAVLKSELLSLTGRVDADYRTAGPPVMLAAREVLALGLTFHELATNALKYGALSRDGGTLSITWDATVGRKGRDVRIVWEEALPEAIDTPADSGFGSRLIDAAVTRELNGEIERKFRRDGLTITIRFPLTGPEAGKEPSPGA